MTNPIIELLREANAKVERAERKIVEAERERAEARIEIAAYERAARAIGLQSEFALSDDSAGTTRPVSRMRATRVPATSSAWSEVFRLLTERHPDGFGYDEIASCADALNVPYKRPSLRTKMMNHVNEGSMERIGNGKFQITDKGVSLFQTGKRHNENGEAEASPDADEAATSSNC